MQYIFYTIVLEAGAFTVSTTKHRQCLNDQQPLATLEVEFSFANLALFAISAHIQLLTMMKCV